MSGDAAALQKLLRAAAGLPEIEESTSYGTPSLKVRKKFLARVKDGETVVLACALDHKEMLLSAAPDIFFETDHYRGWPAILLRIHLIGDGELRHRLEHAWRMQAPKRLVAALDRERNGVTG